MEHQPTTEEWRVILSALTLANPDTPLGQTITTSAIDLAKSYMGDNIVVETAYNEGNITIRGFGIPDSIINKME